MKPDDGPRIGPNALIQTAAALRALKGEAATRRIFAHAGLSQRLAAPPEAMVPAREAQALMASLGACLPASSATAIAIDGGRRTGDYLLANRIPAPIQRLLRAAPRWFSAWALGRAITAHAWTFAGGASVRARCRGGVVIVIDDEADPLTRAWRCAVLERLFGALVAPAASVRAEGRSYAVRLS